MNISSKSFPKYLTLAEIKTKCKELKILTVKGMTRTSIIHTIQETEGTTACFKSSVFSCQQIDCCWYAECQTNRPIPG